MKSRRYILGTAGHVDHGKTELVRALTGWETDRLKEEKARGISIELGFAPLELDGDTMIGVVDVPGHERFVKQMVAGAGGIDLAILVVAADEGVMPQTREHLEVLRSLHVEHGVVVVTKRDLADDDMVELVEEDIRTLVQESFLEGAAVIHTSTKTRQGIDELKTALLELSGHVTPRDAGGDFRLAVDRVFHKQGIGAVITGSCYSGTVSIGDALELMPGERACRVRNIESFGGPREQGYAGERLAIALQGAKLDGVQRGDMLVTPGRFVASYMIDARIYVATYAKFELKQRERIRFHHGAREVLGRVALLENDVMHSGDRGLVQFRLESPVVAGRGDDIVIRKYSPGRVLGGGRVLDANADKHKPRDEVVLAHLRLQEEGNPADRLHKRIADAGVAGVRSSEVDSALAGTLVEDGTVVAIDKLLYAAAVLRVLGERIDGIVADYVAAHPLRRGMDKEELRQRVAFTGGIPTFNRVLDTLAGHHGFSALDNRVVPASAPELTGATEDALGKLTDAYRQAGVAFPRNEEAGKLWTGSEPFSDALQYLRDEGVLIRIADDAHIHHDALAACRTTLADWFRDHEELSVGEFKDLLDITRRHAIPILEYADNGRVTTRRGNARVAGPRLGRE